MRASGAPSFAALHGLLSVGNRRINAPGSGFEGWTLTAQKQPADEDHQAAKIVFIKATDAADEIPIQRQSSSWNKSYLGLYLRLAES
ncbi:MAG: hypothetical protein NVSMB57_07370 [Actinomycetota bacterium]